MDKKEEIIKGGDIPRLSSKNTPNLTELAKLAELYKKGTPNLDIQSIMNSIPFFDSIECLNFTDSLKQSVKDIPGLSYKIVKEVNEMNRHLGMSLEEELNEPSINYKLTEIHLNDKGVYDELVYDGVRYK